MPAARKFKVVGSNLVHVQDEGTHSTVAYTFCHRYINLTDWVIDSAKVTCEECKRAVLLQLEHLQSIHNEIN